MALHVFTLPDVGEGLTEAEILAWRVKPGDTVTVNQPLVEIETAKAAVELPSPYAGVIHECHGSEGEVLAVGAPLVTIELPLDTAAVEKGAPASDAKREAVLVGYGVAESGTPVRRRRTASAEAVSPHGTVRPEAGPPGEAVKPVRHGGLEVGRHTEAVFSQRSPVLAKPPVRRLARDLGVDLSAVSPTGLDGVVTRADVERASSAPETGAVERIPVRSVQRAMAAAMVRSAFTAPHVTEWVQVDVTRSLRLLKAMAGRPSILLLATLGLVQAVEQYPLINSSWDEDAQEIVRYSDINVGIAAATPRGLLVPNIKASQQLSVDALQRAIGSLVEAARAGATAPTDLTGGTITITNVGVFGIDGGTPILNPGEAAILCLGQVRKRPWVHKGEVRPRSVMELALSFDHRIVDGALGSKALAAVAAFLNRPVLG